MLFNKVKNVKMDYFDLHISGVLPLFQINSPHLTCNTYVTKFYKGYENLPKKSRLGNKENKLSISSLCSKLILKTEGCGSYVHLKLRLWLSDSAFDKCSLHQTTAAEGCARKEGFKNFLSFLNLICGLQIQLPEFQIILVFSLFQQTKTVDI